MKKKSTKPKRLKNLNIWDWEILVAAWRYYENRSTIAATMFPINLIRRYFTGKYKEEVCHKIANQFVNIDHGNGEKYDFGDSKTNHQWQKLYAFLKAYLNGFTIKDGVECFYCETSKLYYIKDKYIENPFADFYMVD